MVRDPSLFPSTEHVLELVGLNVLLFLGLPCVGGKTIIIIIT